MSLHGLWDTGLITKAIREQHNYTRRLPSCVSSPNDRVHSLSGSRCRPQIERDLVGAIYDPYVRFILWEGVRVWWRNSFHEWFDCSGESLAARMVTGVQRYFGIARTTKACARTWAKETHKTACSSVFPAHYNYTAPPREVNTPEYYGPIRGAGNLTICSCSSPLTKSSNLKIHTSSKSCSHRPAYDSPSS